TQAGYYGISRHTAVRRAEHYLSLLGLYEKRHVIARQLSGGMKRRLMIARALVHEPRILILDEPTAGVDIELRRSMWEFLTRLNRSGTTVILTTHYLEEAETLCRRIAIIDHGRIVENTDMKSLLATLNAETFILDLRQDLPAPVELPGYTFKLTDVRTLEVTVPRDKNINDVFIGLSAQGVEVMSLRNKANRLEELFVARVERNLTPAGGRA
ncbi:MAG: ABC transporter ATP-binding protein, partial [Pseudomonadales bacterium]|nr:ABC transporter ATP-binding protein [Pseudomonadales bacterium]